MDIITIPSTVTPSTSMSINEPKLQLPPTPCIPGNVIEEDLTQVLLPAKVASSKTRLFTLS